MIRRDCNLKKKESLKSVLELREREVPLVITIMNTLYIV